MLLAGRLLRAGVRPILLIAVSSFALIVRLLVYALVPTLGGAVVGQLFHALVYGIFHPAAIMFVSNNIAPDRRSVGMAMYTSIGNGLPTVLGSALGGYVIEWLGYGGLFASYTLFALASLIMTVLFGSVLMTRAVAQS
jgi:PPP family 3-phenylpropionic acid transporter